jgi:hypothetical protein
MTKNQPTASTSIAPTTYKIPTGLFHPDTPIPHDDTTDEPTFPTLNEGYIDPNPTNQPPIGPGGPHNMFKQYSKLAPLERWRNHPFSMEFHLSSRHGYTKFEFTLL